MGGAADALLADRGVFNLLPIVLRALDRDEWVDVFGGDWPTPDGFCVRDYVHVEDLADAHLAAVQALEGGRLVAGIYNVGRGEGVSVLEMLAAVQRAVGRPVPHRVLARRPGQRGGRPHPDPARPRLARHPGRHRGQRRPRVGAAADLIRFAAIASTAEAL